MSEILQAIFTIVVTIFITNMGIALYGVFSRPSLIKKTISLVLFTDSINIIAISIGFRILEEGYPKPPILPKIPETPAELEYFVQVSVDPLLQALVLTAIVIGFAINMFIIGLVKIYYRHYGTTDIRVSLEEGKHEKNN
ncbi:MAG: Na+/H+ antiporter subunit C [Thermoprotei archaeon]|nr:MAG: Na+/H+ antiporter subunit C [Thermoprotei archaeon]